VIYLLIPDKNSKAYIFSIHIFISLKSCYVHVCIRVHEELPKPHLGLQYLHKKSTHCNKKKKRRRKENEEIDAGLYLVCLYHEIGSSNRSSVLWFRTKYRHYKIVANLQLLDTSLPFGYHVSQLRAIIKDDALLQIHILLLHLNVYSSLLHCLRNVRKHGLLQIFRNCFIISLRLSHFSFLCVKQFKIITLIMRRQMSR
jgi:hypothetical protein